MPLPDDAATPVIPSPRDSRPAPLSRRSVLRGAASAGAAGLAVTALAASPALAASQHAHAGSPADEHVPDQIAEGDAVVVHVRNIRSGEMDVYRGTTYVRVQDRALAARLARASQ
jgi:nucleotide-binding universal stress UspA family protein